MLECVATAILNLYIERKLKKLQTMREHNAKYFQCSKIIPIYTCTSDMFRYNLIVF